MNDKKFKAENLVIARTCFLYPKKGMYKTSGLPKVLLYLTEDGLVNLFDLTDQKPLIGFSHHREERLVLKGGKIEDPNENFVCYMWEETMNNKALPKQEYTLEELEDFILKDDEFYFENRSKIARKRLKEGKEPFRMWEIILDDHIKIKRYKRMLQEFERTKENGYEKIKR